jgi:hypothetical protein
VKNIILLVAMLSQFLISCSRDENPYDEVKGFYERPHQLRKMFTADQEVTVKEPGRGSLSGGFFLFVGGVSGEYREGTTEKYQVTHVRFAWEITNNTYIISTLPLDKIRIKLVEKYESPTISLFLNELAIKEDCKDPSYKYPVEKLMRDLRHYYNPHEAINRYLDYAIFTVENKDWPKNINLPTGGFGQ